MKLHGAGERAEGIRVGRVGGGELEVLKTNDIGRPGRACKSDERPDTTAELLMPCVESSDVTSVQKASAGSTSHAKGGGHITAPASSNGC
jgi:hypothetical protein